MFTGFQPIMPDKCLNKGPLWPREPMEEPTSVVWVEKWREYPVPDRARRLLRVTDGVRARE